MKPFILKIFFRNHSYLLIASSLFFFLAVLFSFCSRIYNDFSPFRNRLYPHVNTCLKREKSNLLWGGVTMTTTENQAGKMKIINCAYVHSTQLTSILFNELRCNCFMKMVKIKRCHSLVEVVLFLALFWEFMIKFHVLFRFLMFFVHWRVGDVCYFNMFPFLKSFRWPNVSWE